MWPSELFDPALPLSSMYSSVECLVPLDHTSAAPSLSLTFVVEAVAHWRCVRLLPPSAAAALVMHVAVETPRPPASPAPADSPSATAAAPVNLERVCSSGERMCVSGDVNEWL